MTRSPTCILLAFLIAGCAAAPQQDAIHPDPAPDIEELAQAKAAVAKTRSVGFLWEDTDTLLNKAQSAAEAGRVNEAIVLADLAKFQAETAYGQYELARLEFLRSNIDPKTLSESKLKALIEAGRMIEVGNAARAAELLAGIDAEGMKALPAFATSDKAYASKAATAEQHATGKSAETAEYRLRRVAGRPTWRSLRLIQEDNQP